MSNQQDLAFTKAPAAEESVECLGMTFESEKARRAHFLGLLEEKLKDPAFRSTPGFPHGSDKAILELSDPPFYTACPNPFLEEVVQSWVTESPPDESRDRRTPFANDIEVGKGDRNYYIHGYHTKVPPRAVAQLLNHYTHDGAIVLDSFCGSGMTGLGTALSTIPNLRSVLSDLSPAATFITYFHNRFRPTPQDEEEVRAAFAEARSVFGDRFQTRHTGWLATGDAPANNPRPSMAERREITYVVWSELIRCPACGHEGSLWDYSVDLTSKAVRTDFNCTSCDLLLTRQIKGARRRQATIAEPVYETVFDASLRVSHTRVRRLPCLISYEVDGKRYEKYPDEDDLSTAAEANMMDISFWHPTDVIPPGDKTGDPKRAGIVNVHHYHSRRALAILAILRDRLSGIPGALGFLTAIITRCSWQNRYMPQHRDNRNRQVVGPLSGTLYIPYFALEVNPVVYGEKKANDIIARLARLPVTNVLVSTGCAAGVGSQVADMVDYSFVDPPFGANLQYSELSFAIESWLGVTTNNSNEAVVNEEQKKTVLKYTELMRASFRSIKRALRPSAWVTIEFSNSSNAIWRAIQQACGEAGLVIADVRVLDKRKGTTKQLTQANTAKTDLIIAAYKPTEALARSFKLGQASEDGAWAFVREHLGRVPVFVGRANAGEVVAERTAHMLLDRMIAFHVQRGFSVPLSAPEFLQGLAHRFPERDEMYFLSDQVAEYDRKRTSVSELRQLSFFVNDEASAIQWVRQQLQAKPQSFQDLTPQYMREVQAWAKHEETVELKTILEQSFLYYNGRGPVPSQIHSYLSTNYKDLRNLDKADPRLVEKARDRWYVADPNKQAEREAIRERALLREFEEYKASTQRKLKVFRTEAVRVGFKACWQERDYGTIVRVSEKLPDAVLQEDEKLLMYYDNALTRLGDG